MANPEQESTMRVGIPNTSEFNDFLQAIGESDVFNIIDSITFDTRSQTIIFQIQNLVKKEADKVDSRLSGDASAYAQEIMRLSEKYKETYPELLDCFKEWKPSREKLINLLNQSSDKIERNSTLTSAFRILTSAADILGTLGRSGGASTGFSWADFAMDHASTCGIMALFLEITLSQKIHIDVKKAIKKDQIFFKKMVEWFQQTKELDAAIRSFFPYGIQTDIVKKINSCSQKFDEYNKVFMSIVASNVKQDVKLFKDKEFLNKADRVATSEAGKQWFHRVILENDPYFKHCLNADLCDEIGNIQKKINKLSPTENVDLYVEASRALSSKVEMKIVLNVMTIVSAGSALLFGAQQEESETLQDMSEYTKKELGEITKIVRCLKPSDFEIDPILEQ